MKHKITITTKGFTSFDTMQTTIICRKPSKIAKCIDAGAKHIPHWDRKRTDVNIAQVVSKSDNIRADFTKSWYNSIAQ